MNDTELKALVARNPINPKYGVPVPLIMICNVSGVEKKYTAPEYIRGKLDGAGGLENFLKAYVAKGATKDAKGATKAPGKTWGGEAIIKETSPKPDVSDDKAPAKEMVLDIFLHDHHGEHTITKTTSPRQNADRKTVVVHDHRKDKSSIFAPVGLFPETLKQLKEAGIILAVK